MESVTRTATSNRRNDFHMWPSALLLNWHVDLRKWTWDKGIGHANFCSYDPTAEMEMGVVPPFL